MKKLPKLLLILLISGSVGGLIYWGGKKTAAVFRAAKEARKSAIAKKTATPKADQKQPVEDQEEPAVAEKNDYTFFETLNDPEMKKIVGLNNNIQDEPIIPPRRLENKPAKKEIKPENIVDSTEAAKLEPLAQFHIEENKTLKESKPESKITLLEPVKALPPPHAEVNKAVSAGSENNKKAQVAPASKEAKPPQKSKVTEPAPENSKGDDDKTYTVQISSFKDLARAQELQTRLQKKGYPAYLLTASGKDGLVYRVFLGKYIGQNKAKSAANKLKREDKIDAVVVLVPE